jgi:cleavage stimulation factor subunit 2
VLNFRLVYDKETGRPKGFGFAEFADSDSAASAVRNLNDYELMGRKLRVDWSNDNGAGDNAPASNPAPVNGQPEVAAAAPQSAALPPLPPGADLQPNLSCPDSISVTLGTLPAPQLLDIISQMKGLVMTDPAKATEVFRQAPQLAYAIFQALLLLGLVETNVLGSLIDQPPAAAAPPQQVQTPAPQPARPPQNYSGYPPQPVPTPPQGMQQPYGQPPQPAQPALTPEQLVAYQQVMALNQAQIDSLDPASRAQIMQVRQQFAALMGHA